MQKYSQISRTFNQIAMNLELKHLSPYLPYGLKLQFIIREEVVRTGVMTRLLNYSHETHPERVAIDNYDSEHIWMFKPILRPMSDINSTIETKDGDKNFASLLDLIKDEDGDWCEIVYVDQCESPFVLSLVTGVNWWMFENHFDVFGLIDAGLAIDINTVPELLNT